MRILVRLLSELVRSKFILWCLEDPFPQSKENHAIWGAGLRALRPRIFNSLKRLNKIIWMYQYHIAF